MAHSFSDNRHPFDTMTLTGQGTVMATPDMAVIRLGVQTTGYDLPQIQADNAQISQRIIQSLSQAGYTDIRTIQYSIDRIYEYQDGNPIDKGYSVRNMIEIRTNYIDQAGNIIDTAVNMGANVVDSISFELSDPQLYYQHALNLAVDNAIQKAKSIAANLRIKLSPVPVRIIEGGAPAVPLQQFQREAAATPILPGEMRIEASITADFLYS
ncbi:SIMPL domain-containing protein [Clostridium aminobutyricum]|uniref:SIMPL domain-containing protein n=1 Tax=Clostridium aminobutyricum TaxID=33953 RepID=A0A939D7R2_CLOAM|nr:SIMPL domain-containing protein [Clostridium aminobutyricum]MBN7772293.1 SIMPL domain-containing protein [Clostridium aminobutyricum]